MGKIIDIREIKVSLFLFLFSNAVSKIVIQLLKMLHDVATIPRYREMLKAAARKGTPEERTKAAVDLVNTYFSEDEVSRHMKEKIEEVQSLREKVEKHKERLQDLARKFDELSGKPKLSPPASSSSSPLSN